MNKKNIKIYIPSGKSDIEVIIELSKMPYPYYKPILRDLFEWIKDMNWPVAKEIVPLLVAAGDDIIPHVRFILESNDAIWEYWALYSVVDKMPVQVIQALKFDLERIINNPSNEEISEEVPEMAKDLLKRLYDKKISNENIKF